MVKILEIINEEFIAPNECLAVIFADSKEELSSEYSVSGLPTGRTLAQGSKFKTADGSEGYLKSDGDIEWVEQSSDLPPVDSTDDGKVLQVVDGEWEAAEFDALPPVTGTDDGKVLTVKNGAWAVDECPVTQEEIANAVEDYCSETYSEWSGALDPNLESNVMAAPANKVGELKSALTNTTSDRNYNSNLSSDIWEQGGLYVTGSNWNSNKHIRTKTFITPNIARVIVGTGYTGYVIGYNASGVCQGSWNQNTKTFDQSGAACNDFTVPIELYPNYKYRYFFKKSDSADIDTTAYSNVVFKNLYYVLDEKTSENITDFNMFVGDETHNANIYKSTWEQGGLYVNGSNWNSNKHIRTKGFIPNYISRVIVDSAFYGYVIGYNSAGVCQGSWNYYTKTFDDQGQPVSDFVIPKETYPNYKYRVYIKKTDDSDITPSAFSNVFMGNQMYEIQEEFDAIDNALGNINDKINRIVSDSHDVNNSDFWELHGFDANTGTIDNSWNDKIRTKEYLRDDVTLVSTVESNINLRVYAYNSVGTYIGTWNPHLATFDKLALPCKEFDLNAVRVFYPGYQFKLMLQSDNGTVSDYSNVVFYNEKSRSVGLRGRKPTLSFIDDDGYSESVEIWNGIVDDANIEMSMALVTNSVDTANHITTAAAKRVDNKGIELISHTHNHLNLNTDIPEQDIIDDFTATISKLRELYGTPNFVVYPYTQISDTNKQYVKNYFLCGIGEGDAINNINIQRSYVSRFSINLGEREDIEVGGETINAYPFRSLDNMKELVRRAYMTNGWIIFMTHLRNTYNGDGFYYTNDIGTRIKDLCDYAKSIGMEVSNVAHGYEKFKNMMI